MNRENQLLRGGVHCFVRLIWTREDYSWKGGWLWKDYGDGNMDFPSLEDHSSQIVDGSLLCAMQKLLKENN